MDDTQTEVLKWLSYWWPLWAAVVICFMIVTSFMLGKLWKDREDLSESVISIKGRLSELKNDLTSIVKGLGVDIKGGLEVHHSRLVILEEVNKRWDSGHKLDRGISEVQNRLSSVQSSVNSVHTNFNELSNELHETRVGLEKEVGGVKKELAIIQALGCSKVRECIPKDLRKERGDGH